jgi:hypothetical protein
MVFVYFKTQGSRKIIVVVVKHQYNLRKIAATKVSEVKMVQAEINWHQRKPYLIKM